MATPAREFGVKKRPTVSPVEHYCHDCLSTEFPSPSVVVHGQGYLLKRFVAFAPHHRIAYCCLDSRIPKCPVSPGCHADCLQPAAPMTFSAQQLHQLPFPRPQTAKYVSGGLNPTLLAMGTGSSFKLGEAGVEPAPGVPFPSLRISDESSDFTVLTQCY